MFVIGFIYGCNNPKVSQTQLAEDSQKKSMSFSVSNLKTSVGKYERKKNTEILSFSLQLKNLDSQDTTIQSITPLYKQELKENLAEDPKKSFPVNQLLRSGDSITIKGEVLLNTANTNSKSNSSWKPYIIGFKVLNEKFVR